MHSARLARPSINTASSPNLNLATSTAIARKASLNALTAGLEGSASHPAKSVMVGRDGREVEVGDAVDVPGDMHGIVKFIGPVRGKQGIFVGVELSKQFATRGKNDGDVDGARYFTTSVPGSGIFLPVHRASRRDSLSSSSDTFPFTPPIPLIPNSARDASDIRAKSPLETLPKFSQSMSPGARPSSPIYKSKDRQSLPRPGSPMRKKSILLPASGRPPNAGQAGLPQSQIVTPRFTPSPRLRTATGNKTPQMGRPFSRTNSRLTNNAVDDGVDTTPTMPARSSDGSGTGTNSTASSGLGFAGRHSTEDSQEEVRRLKRKLEERDTQLKDQAASLAEMESSLTELQSLIPIDGMTQGCLRGALSHDDLDVAQLRSLVREKNEKISMLTAEFDAHRADFRSTIDTLELASTETERVYEKRVEELLQEIRDLQERGDDVDSVARQLKHLEDLVQELEEGLEDARRGEAEARTEVEFLRGEVERCRAELRREQDKMSVLLKSGADGSEGARDTRDIEQRDDEIRGLKAIIHSLSSGPSLADAVKASAQLSNSQSLAEPETLIALRSTVERLEREKMDLQGLVEQKSFREEELERELDLLIRPDHRISLTSNGFSDRTTMLERRSSARDSKGTVVSWKGSGNAKSTDAQSLAPMAEMDSASSTNGSGILWCEICEIGGHDILTCIATDTGGDSAIALNKPNPSENAKSSGSPVRRLRTSSVSSQEQDKPKPLSASRKLQQKIPPLLGVAPTAPLPNPLVNTPSDGLFAGKDGNQPDPNKWCAICERDGHDSINCSFDVQIE